MFTAYKFVLQHWNAIGDNNKIIKYNLNANNQDSP